MIEVGQNLPSVNVTIAETNNFHSVNMAEWTANKKVVLFALPGAFTPTCSAAHLPGYVVNADAFKAKGVDAIACLSVNDAFVMEAWGQAQNAQAITMMADGGAAFTKATGLDMDSGDFGGTRSRRYAMIIENGVVTALHVEQPKQFEVSTAEAILNLL